MSTQGKLEAEKDGTRNGEFDESSEKAVFQVAHFRCGGVSGR